VLLALPACSSDEAPAQNDVTNNTTATATTGGGISCDVDAAMVSCQGIICHGAPGTAPAITLGAGLDLFGADRVSKLINRPAKYTAVANPEACPTTPELLINSQNPAASLMVTKLQGTQLCGEVMPFGLTIEEADKQCILEWVNLIATDPNAAAAVTTSTSTTSTSTSTSTSATTSSTSSSSVGTTGAGGTTSTTSTVSTTSSTDGMAVGGATSVGSTGMGMGGSTGMGGSSTMATGAGGSMAAGGSSGI
jgi:hypothetical protein